VLAAVAACGREAPEHPVRTIQIDGTRYVVRDTQLTDGFVAAGIAEPVQQAMLASKLMARVLELLVQEGDQVTQGQLLARLDAREIEARSDQVAAGLAAAEAGHREALAQASRIRALFADSAATRAQLDQVEAGLVRAESSVRQARAAAAELDAMNDYATLHAPFAGTITQRLVDVGSLVAPGQPLLEIKDQSVLRISVTAGPDAVRQLRRGQTVTGELAGRPVETVIEGIVPAPAGHLVTVNATVRNRDRDIYAGSSATLLLPQGVRLGRLVPTAAVIEQGDLTGVYLRKDGAVDLRWVRLGTRHGDRVEVLSGLAPGDTVIVRTGGE
jgi:RND family efflux transporter MFP subunit